MATENKEIEIPVVLSDEDTREAVLDYLDELRRDGVTNMFGAGQYIEDDFGFSRQDARAALSYWMKTFGARRDAGLTGDT